MIENIPGKLDCFNNLCISSAPADISTESSSDLHFVRMSVFFQYCRSCHNHSRCAISTLDSPHLQKASLDNTKTSLPNSFNRHDFSVICFHDRYQTAFLKYTVDQYRTGTTFSGITSFFGSY